MRSNIGPVSVEVAIEYSEHGDEVGIILLSSDGSRLTPQMISDSIIETLLYEGMEQMSARPLDS